MPGVLAGSAPFKAARGSPSASTPCWTCNGPAPLARAPDGTEHALRGEYLELNRPAKIVQTFVYEPWPNAVSVESVQFEEGRPDAGPWGEPALLPGEPGPPRRVGHGEWHGRVVRTPGRACRPAGARLTRRARRQSRPTCMSSQSTSGSIARHALTTSACARLVDSQAGQPNSRLRGQRLVAQQLGARMVLRIAGRYPGYPLAAERQPSLRDGRDRSLQRRAGNVVRDGSPQPVDLRGGRLPIPAQPRTARRPTRAGNEPTRRTTRPGASCTVSCPWRTARRGRGGTACPGRMPAPAPPPAPRSAPAPTGRRPACGCPERLGVVRLEVLVEVERSDRDPVKGQRCGHHHATKPTCSRISRSSPSPVSSARTRPSGCHPAERKNARETWSSSGSQMTARVMPSVRA